MNITGKARTPWIALITALLLWLSGPDWVQAAQKTVTSTLGPKPTNWSDSLSVDKFNPADGILSSVEVLLEGSVNGTAKYESTDPKPAVITLKLSADIQLQRPNSADLLMAAPAIFKVENASAHDGTIDYAGTSGSTFPDLAATASSHTVLTAPGDLALFSGAGKIVLPVKATGTSNGGGSGNLIAEFTVNALAFVQITYTYTPTAPAIDLVKHVYAGHNGGASCPAKKSLVGNVGDPITYCFTITNTGVTYLSTITLNDLQLNLTLSNPNLKLKSGNPNAPLPPGGKLVYYYETTLQGDLDNTARTEGNPTDQNGVDLVNFANVKDSSTAQVRVAITAAVTACKIDASNNLPLPGWTINLNGPHKQSGQTGVDGCITFTVNQSGNYSLTETLQPGWVQVTPGGNGTYFFTVTPNSSSGPYQFVNFHTATAKACKVDDVSGAPLPGWELNLNGPGQQHAITGADGCVNFTITQGGTYSLTETPQFGWTQIAPTNPPFFLLGQIQPGASYGQNNEYRFRNRSTAGVTVIKAASPADGTDFTFSGGLGNFTLDDAVNDDNDGITSSKIFTNVLPGAYVITESLPSGWQVAGFTCTSSDSSDTSVQSGNSGIIDVDPGEQLICSVTNTKRGVLQVIKLVENSFGGSAQPENFTINVSGNNPSRTSLLGSANGVTVLLNSGAYSVTEQAVVGYIGEYSADCAGVIVEGETKVCTIVNRQQPQGQGQDHAWITLFKVVENNNSGTATAKDFTLTVDGAPLNSGQTVTVSVGSPHVINELSKVGYQFVALTGTGCPAQLGGTIVPQGGQSLVCTITNRAVAVQPGTAQLGDFAWRDDNKDGLQNDGPNSALAGVTAKLYQSDGTFTGLTRITDSNGQYLFENLPPGSYYVVFTEPTGYAFTQPYRNGDDASNNDVNPATGQTPIVTLLPGQRNTQVDAGFVPSAVLVVSKEAAAIPIQPGTYFTYTINYANQGVVDALRVVITETVPNFTTFQPQRSTPGWVCRNNAVVAGTQCVFTVGKLVANSNKGALLFVVRVNSPLNVPDDGVVLFNQLQVTPGGTTTKTCCLISTIVGKPTASGESAEPQRGQYYLYLPSVSKK